MNTDVATDNALSVTVDSERPVTELYRFGTAVAACTPQSTDPVECPIAAEIITLSQRPGLVTYVHVAPDGSFVVCSISHCGNVLVFDKKGQFVRKIEYQNMFPAACAVGSDWTVYVSDYANNNITVFFSDSSIVRKFTSIYLVEPDGIALDHDKSILYVASRGTNCICAFDTEGGKPLRHFSVQNPRGVAVLRSGAILVSSQQQQSDGCSPNYLWMYNPAGMCIKAMPLLAGTSIASGLAVDYDKDAAYVEMKEGVGVLVVLLSESAPVALFREKPGRGLHCGVAVCADGTVVRASGGELRLVRRSFLTVKAVE